jgi:hypothetical protein
MSMSALTVATLQQSFFALHQGSLRVILEECPQEKSATVKSGDRRAMENPPFYFMAVVSALCSSESN